jgi:hypothetical protein
LFTDLAALVFCALAVFAAGFQMAFALGMPWGLMMLACSLAVASG